MASLAPVYSSSNLYIDENFITLVFDKALDSANPPPTSAFALQVNGTDVTVTGVAVDGTNKTVKVSFTRSLSAGDAVAVAYTDPTADNDVSAIQGVDTLDVAAFSTSTVVSSVRPTGVTITPTGGSTQVTEGGATDTYTVVLDSAPTADVTITLDDTNGQVSLSTTTLTFTTANWNAAQTVTVTARNDTVGEGTHTGTIGHTVTSTDGNYNNLAVKPLIVTITDNDLPTGNPNFLQYTGATSAAPFGLSDVGRYASPTLVDIDGDGDLDAFIGNNSGNTLFFR
ncbi:SwmB domain-containing protein, partial [Macromonas bipunctata]|uniref:SwmB domain-containing protein n=1 Tax=Macromonas bipunctata TaxID=183670 RepID=UPI0023E8859A